MTDSEVEYLGATNSQEIENLPHCRADCIVHPFKTTAHITSCASCWCFVCEVPVISCRNWSNHCDADPNNKAHAYTWKKLRKDHRNAKKTALACGNNTVNTLKRNADAAFDRSDGHEDILTIGPLLKKSRAVRKASGVGQKAITSFFQPPHNDPLPFQPQNSQIIVQKSAEDSAREKAAKKEMYMQMQAKQKKELLDRVQRELLLKEQQQQTSSSSSSSLVKIVKYKGNETSDDLISNFELPIQPMVNEFGRVFYICPCGEFLRTQDNEVDEETREIEIRKHHDQPSERHREFMGTLKVKLELYNEKHSKIIGEKNQIIPVGPAYFFEEFGARVKKDEFYCRYCIGRWGTKKMKKGVSGLRQHVNRMHKEEKESDENWDFYLKR